MHDDKDLDPHVGFIKTHLGLMQMDISVDNEPEGGLVAARWIRALEGAGSLVTAVAMPAQAAGCEPIHMARRRQPIRKVASGLRK